MSQRPPSVTDEEEEEPYLSPDEEGGVHEVREDERLHDLDGGEGEDVRRDRGEEDHRRARAAEPEGGLAHVLGEQGDGADTVGAENGVGVDGEGDAEGQVEDEVDEVEILSAEEVDEVEVLEAEEIEANR